MMADDRGVTRRVLMLLGALVVFAVILRLLPLPDPLTVRLDSRFLPPLSDAHLLGTDDLGRDVLGRLLLGVSVTLMVSVAAALVAFAIGIVGGGIAGYFLDSPFDKAFNWVVNLILSLPFLLVMAAILSVMQPSLLKAYAVLTALMWVAPARVVRAEVARQRQLGYVRASLALGTPEWKILAFRLVPRASRPALAVVYSYLPEVIALEAGLSFLGLGVQPPQPALGKMIFDGLPYLYAAWWLPILPAALLFVIVLAINLTAYRQGGTRAWA